MKNINISIAKAEVFEDVSLSTAYTGAKTDVSKDFFLRVATDKADIDILDRFWRITCSCITEKLKDFIRSSDFSGQSLNLSLELSSAYDEALTPAVEKDLFAFISAAITTRWFTMTFPERASEWETLSSSLLSRVIANLCHRKKPSRTLS